MYKKKKINNNIQRRCRRRVKIYVRTIYFSRLYENNKLEEGNKGRNIVCVCIRFVNNVNTRI